jgi:N-acyl-D-amino-acid deacylase
MYAPPPAPVSRQADGSLEKSYYGCGWSVRPVGKEGKANYWHAGSLPGTSTLLVRRADGLSWAALFNQRSDNKQLPDDAIDSALHRAADNVEKWPEEDLFPRYQ